MANDALRLTLFGSWRLCRDGRPVDVTTCVQRLVAFLAVTGPCNRAYVVGVLWPEQSEQHAHGSLRTVLWRLRRRSGGVPRLIGIEGESLALHEDVAVDVNEFVSCATELLHRPERPVSEAAFALLTSRDLLPGWYDDWLQFERERLRQLRLHALETLAARWCSQGRHAEALEAALTAVQIEPLRESPHRLVIEVHLAEGNVSEALRQYRYFDNLLFRELQARPTNQLVALVRPLTSTGSDVAVDTIPSH
jgi:DNA-binding SARP family transcriptional activator